MGRLPLKQKKMEGETVTNQAGAIIRIICYILTRCNRLNQEFNASYIVEEYQNGVHQSKITDITEKFKKHDQGGTFWAFETSANLESWLTKHSGTKEITWFKKTNAGFLLIVPCPVNE